MLQSATCLIIFFSHLLYHYLMCGGLPHSLNTLAKAQRLLGGMCISPHTVNCVARWITAKPVSGPDPDVTSRLRFRWWSWHGNSSVPVKQHQMICLATLSFQIQIRILLRCWFSSHESVPEKRSDHHLPSRWSVFLILWKSVCYDVGRARNI